MQSHNTVHDTCIYIVHNFTLTCSSARQVGPVSFFLQPLNQRQWNELPVRQT